MNVKVMMGIIVIIIVLVVLIVYSFISWVLNELQPLYEPLKNKLIYANQTFTFNNDPGTANYYNINYTEDGISVPNSDILTNKSLYSIKY